MDFSGIGMMLVSCCFMALVPPIPAVTLFLVVHTDRKNKGVALSGAQDTGLIALLYVLSLVGSCLFIYFFYLRYM